MPLRPNKNSVTSFLKHVITFDKSYTFYFLSYEAIKTGNIMCHFNLGYANSSEEIHAGRSCQVTPFKYSHMYTRIELCM